MLIGISGKLRTGKDLFYQYLCQSRYFQNRKFAAKVKLFEPLLKSINNRLKNNEMSVLTMEEIKSYVIDYMAQAARQSVGNSSSPMSNLMEQHYSQVWAEFYDVFFRY